VTELENLRAELLAEIQAESDALIGLMVEEIAKVDRRLDALAKDFYGADYTRYEEQLKRQLLERKQQPKQPLKLVSDQGGELL
jgi:hypothetical protein